MCQLTLIGIICYGHHSVKDESNLTIHSKIICLLFIDILQFIALHEVISIEPASKPG